MAKAYLRPGVIVNIDSSSYELKHMISENKWQLAEMETGRYVTYTNDELLELYAGKKLKFVPVFENGYLESKKDLLSVKQQVAFDLLPDKIREAAKVKYAIVIAVRNARLQKLSEKTLRPVIASVWDTLHRTDNQPHWITVKRWCDSFESSGGDIRVLVDRHDCKGRRFHFDRKLLELAEQAVKEVYLTRLKKTKQKTLKKAEQLVAQHNQNLPEKIKLKKPTIHLINYVLGKIPEYEIVRARHGWDYAKNVYRSVRGALGTEYVLQKVEIDHTPVNVVVRHDETLMPLGRPYFTVAIEVFSRTILGIYIGFEPPSFASVAQCLKHAFMPKLGLREQYKSLESEWEVFGIPESIVVDNGMEFHSKHLEHVCYSLGIEIIYAPRKQGWKKPHVERFINTISQDLFNALPGTTFSSQKQRGDYDSVRKAELTLSELKEIVYKWIVDIYHKSKHRTLGAPPIEIWRKNHDVSKCAFNTSVEDLEAIIGATDKRFLTHKGIEINSLFYNSKQLSELRKRINTKEKVVVRYDPTDVGHIHVIDPETNNAIFVPALEYEYANGLSLWSHEVCRRYRKENEIEEDKEGLMKSRMILDEMVDEALRDRRMQTRKKAAKYSSRKPKPNQPQNDAENPVVIDGSTDTQKSATGLSTKSMISAVTNTSKGVRDIKVSYEK